MKWLYKNKLLIILIAASFLRLYKLGSIPPGLTPDEASLGYNAYSILKTGRDEYGSFLPIIFKSFGDWKPGLYVYLTIPLIALFGLNEFTVRLTGAISGVLAVFLLYLITKELFKNRSLKIEKWSLEILAPAMLAISPWHIQFSRGAWEVGVSLTLTLAGILFYLKSFKKPSFLIYSSIFFALTLLTYQGAKLSTLIVVILLVIIYKNDLLKLGIKVLAKSFMLGLIISLPILLSFLSGKTGRLEVFSIFSYPRPENYTQNFIQEANVEKGSLVYDIFYSEPLNFTRGILGRWFNHFSGRFLFFEGDWQNLRHTPPNQGVLLLIDLILLPFGFLFILKSKNQNTKSKLFIIFWLVLAPLPAVLSRDQVQAVRAFNTVVPFVMISSFGVSYLLQSLNRLRGFRVASYGVLFILFLSSFIYYLDAYFVHLPVQDADLWFYGYREMVQEVLRIKNNYEVIKVRQSYAQPYIYFLFYDAVSGGKNFPVRDYQKQARLTENPVDVGLVEELGNIKFEEFSWPAPAKKGELVVGGPIDIPNWFEESGFKFVKEIREPNGNLSFRLVEKL